MAGEESAPGALARNLILFIENGIWWKGRETSVTSKRHPMIS